MSIEKTDRNAKIFCDKLGLTKPTDKTKSKKPLSYTELLKKYHLSITRLQQIVKRERKKYGRS